MNKVTRTVTNYQYTFGTMSKPDDTGAAQVEVTGTYSTFERLGMRDIQAKAKEYGGVLLYTDEKALRAEVSLEDFMSIATVTEI